MWLTVARPNAESLSLEYTSVDTVWDVKTALAGVVGHSPDSLVLWFAGQLLRDDQLLHSVLGDVAGAPTVHLLVRGPAPPEPVREEEQPIQEAPPAPPNPVPPPPPRRRMPLSLSYVLRVALLVYVFGQGNTKRMVLCGAFGFGFALLQWLDRPGPAPRRQTPLEIEGFVGRLASVIVLFFSSLLPTWRA